MAGGYDPGEPGYLDWDRGNLRGLGRRRFVGRDRDPVTGEEVDVYQLEDDVMGDEWGAMSDSEIHLTRHANHYDPSCRFCNLHLKGDL